MPQITRTDVFATWLNDLRDSRAKAKIIARIDRLSLGNPGDVKAVGEGVSEMRVDYGPGYRVYYKTVGTAIYLLLCGGDKSSQDRDIKTAKALAKGQE